jgi:hypothetical protein
VLKEEAQAGGSARTAEEPVWRCASCGNEVARDRDRVPVDGASTRAYVNPDSAEYVIAGFADAQGCAEVSGPSSYWTWFPGCAWQVSVCRSCGVHLGWRFTGAARFHGLIVDRLTAP